MKRRVVNHKFDDVDTFEWESSNWYSPSPQ